MNSCEIVTAVSTAACVISKDLSNEELLFLSAVFMQLADALAVIAANRDLIKSKCQKDIKP